MKHSWRNGRRPGTSTGTVTPFQPVTVMEDRENDSGQVSDANRNDDYRAPTATGPSSITPSMGERERVYDIPTLLNIGSRVARKRGVRFATDDGKFTNRRKPSSGYPVLTQRSVNRQTVSSNMSSAADDDHQPTSRVVNSRYPRRQPINAPQGDQAQKETGFARFLKEHASPKHQRVTAGGRIVPMGGRIAPAPEFKLPTEQHARTNHRGPDHVVPESRIHGDPAHKEVKSDDSNTRQGKSARSTAADAKMPVSVPMRNRGMTMSDSSAMTRQDSGSSGHSSTSCYVPRQREEDFSVAEEDQGHRPQLSAEACPFTPTHTTFDGGNDQSTSAAYSYYPQVSIPQYLSEPYPQPIPACTYPNHFSSNMPGMYNSPSMVTTTPFPYFPVNNIPGAMPCGAQMQSLPATFQTTAGSFQDPSGNKTLEDITQEYESISGQLSSLDRYMAIHTWDIDPLRKKALVDQRIDLVRKLDAARVTKEYLESTSRSAQELPQTLSTFPNHQTAMPYIPFLTGNGMVSMTSNDMMPSARDFQQAVQPGPIFTTQTGGPQYTNVETLNPACESYSVEYGTNNLCAGSVGPEMIPRDNNDGNAFDDVPVRRAVPNKKDATATANDSAKWGKDAEIAPPEISNVYRKIERAAQQGEPLEPYLKELARVVAQMDVASPDQHNTTIQQLHRDPLGYKHNESTTTPAVTHKTDLETKIDRKNSVALSQEQVSDGQPSKREAEKHKMPQENSRGRTSAQLRLEALHGKPFNGASTSGSTQTGMSHGKGTEFNKTVRHPHGATVAGDGADMGDGGDMENKQNKSGIKGSGFHESLSSIKEPPRSHAPKPRGSLFSALSFVPWRQKQSSSVAPKGEISAGMQMINAHGSPPSFDGAGDGKTDTDTRDNRGHTKDEAGKDGKGEGEAKGGGSQRPGQWHQKQERRIHDPMDVRAFFQMLREEDKEMLRKDRRVEHRPFG